MARILIVEDEARIASFVAKGLSADGHRPVVVGDGGVRARRVAAGMTIVLSIYISTRHIDSMCRPRRTCRLFMLAPAQTDY